MQVNSRALLWGGAIGVIVLVIALMVVPFVYVALALAVLLLVALVAVNRMREAADADREADNDESTGRLGTLVDERDDPDYEPYDASTFDSAIFGTATQEARYDESPVYEDVPEAEQYEEFAEPEADWSTGEFGGTTYAAEEDRLDGGRVDEYDTTFRADEYTTAFEGPADTDERTEVAFEEYTGPSRDGATTYEYESSVLDEPLIDESIIEEVDASAVLADEGVIDESKVTTAETILAASQVSRFEPETLTDEESNEETKEILGRVAALLAKYE
jgi:hypothetical protein